MDGLSLLEEARGAGLRVAAEGDRLVIRGPKTAEPVARRLLAHKAEMLAVLTGPRPSAPGPALATSGDLTAGPVPAAPGRPDPAEVARTLRLPLPHLDRVLRVRVSWLDVAVWFVPDEVDTETLVAAGEATRGAVWTRRELLDLLSVPG
jgi:hypothetical protein